MKVMLLMCSMMLPLLVGAQCTGGLNIQTKGAVGFPYPKQAMSALHDANGKSYLYIAGKERGLLIVDITNTSAPKLVDSITTIQLGNMELMSVSQNGNYLYLALGNVFVNSSKPGMAIVDVATPSTPVLKSVWQQGVASGGAGIVKSDGNYAYLGAMRQGVIILDVTDKTAVQFRSQIIPSRLFPVSNPDSLKYNARGMDIVGDKLYLCYDAGGVRIIDISNKLNPIELGRYSNPLLDSRPRAYNNIVVDNGLAYVATDYCGMEILNVSNSSVITQTGWWNPWNCDNAAANNWFNSNGHTNEIQYNKACKLVFLSSGKSEMDVVNVSNPSQPYLCDSFGNTTNTEGTWGIGLYGNQVYLTYIYVPLGIPFYSNYGGVKVLQWNDACATQVNSNQFKDYTYLIYPNPSSGEYYFEFNTKLPEVKLQVNDMLGRAVFERTYMNINKEKMDLSSYSDGFYNIKISTPDRQYNTKIMKLN
ncbi:MAG: T9SS type A sorting domain-containing protein [Bacteroidetes bacterium]|nr:T9SS type A sorting domain-containing protein [Bacteroidota bacterium]